MKKIQQSTKYSMGRKLLPLCIAVLLLGGCTDTSAHPPATSGLSAELPGESQSTTATSVTSTAESVKTTVPVPDTKPLPEDAAYRWDPYVFDRLIGGYEADARLVADAILSYTDAVTLSSAENAQIVADNIAFEFPPSALAEFCVAGDQVKITYLLDQTEHQKQIAAFENAVNRALSILSAEDGEGRRAALLYDYVVQNVFYFSTDYTDKEITAFSALVAGETICYGFADAFGYLLRQTGMEAHLWRGGTYTFTGFSDHGWCYAKVDGKYYHFDPTWEHSNYKASKVNSFAYFGLSDQKRFTSLSRTCVSGFGALEETCDVTKANERLTVTGK